MVRKIGITGGIGSGKSTVCRIFSLLGVAVYDSDAQAKQLMNSDPEVIHQIRTIFGEEAYLETGLNRPVMAARIFHDATLREQLNGIVHPALFADFQQWAQRQQGDYVIQEAAILFECGADRMLDAVVEVSAPEELRIRRTCQRDKTDETSVRARIAAQMSEQERLDRAHYVIWADDRILVIPQVLHLHERFRHL